ncbi:CASP-like protein 1B2 [Alnus glutinosa]|uniref:CASP-like protein 1B2 n=1 Tax=Alnus glutinosa TaxID=3517 RepID=UPI002D788CEE|nr:CASP-like protein 1B2 [Alnus glutinosa]
MAQQDGGKPESGFNDSTPAVQKRSKEYWVLLLLRLAAFLATASATLVMALNKQTKTLVVATIGNTPLKATLTAKFQHTPAFVFFVVANGMASVHSLTMIVVEIFGHKIDYKGLRLAIIAILDMMTVVLASAGDGAATFMAALGKNGNSHARWNKICDKFHTFCDHGSGALIASFIGLLILLIVNVISITKLHNPKSTYNAGFP